MSVTAVFIPGIMGSELVRPGGEVVWPPRPSETIFGYNRIKELQDPLARATRIISSVSCFDFYAPIQSLFAKQGFEAAGTKRLLEHPYDWRRDLFDLADGLAQKLDAVDSDEIIIVAHSMGGLIARLLLETPTWRSRSWFAKISRFIALATPHSGAPLALARVMGLDSALGISAKDFVTLSSNPAFPSGYQLLPAPGEDACWNTDSNAGLVPLDIYTPSVAQHLGLTTALVDRARALHDSFRAGSQPTHVRYFYFSGAGHKTVTRVNVGLGGPNKVETPDAGDGTVPMWSALPRAVQKQVVVNEHAKVFRGGPFTRVFVRLLGGDAGDPDEAPAVADARLDVSLQKPVFLAGDPIEVVLSSELPFADLNGRIVFESRTETDTTIAEIASQPIAYAGPGVFALALTIEVGLAPGLYELHFEGDRQKTDDRVVFAVTRRV